MIYERVRVAKEYIEKKSFKKSRRAREKKG